MKAFVTIEKYVGETPLQALERFRVSDPALEGVPMTYAGRLDPMAQGKLIILIGDECKNRESYTGLDKEYEFEILFGVSSDTGDVLGLAEAQGARELSEKEIKKATQEIPGKHRLPYPAFSSKTVSGKPLFEHALSGSISDLKIPSTDTEVYRISYLSSRSVYREALVKEALEKIGKLRVDSEDVRLGSDFRKEKIIERWESGLLREQSYTVAKFRTAVSSGTYIRSLAVLIAQRLGTKGLAHSICRRKIGRYHSLVWGFGFWTHTF